MGYEARGLYIFAEDICERCQRGVYESVDWYTYRRDSCNHKIATIPGKCCEGARGVIEPMYSLDVAAELVPLTKSALFHILDRKRHLFKEPVYHTFHGQTGSAGMVRMLRESEVLIIRDIVIQRWQKDPTKVYKHRGVRRPNKWSRILFGAGYERDTISA